MWVEILQKLLLLVAVGSMTFGIGYFYIHEAAPVCRFDSAESDSWRECDCRGFEIPMSRAGEDTAETVCLGRVVDVYCYEETLVKPILVECE